MDAHELPFQGEPVELFRNPKYLFPIRNMTTVGLRHAIYGASEFPVRTSKAGLLPESGMFEVTHGRLSVRRLRRVERYLSRWDCRIPAVVRGGLPGLLQAESIARRVRP